MSHHQPPRIIEVSLSDSSRERVGTIAAARPYPLDEHYEDYIAWARDEVFAALPANVRGLCQQTRMHPAPTAALVLRNLPTDPILPPTPTDGERALGKETHRSEALLVAVAANLGDGLVGFRREKQSLINDIVPLAGAERHLSNRGSLQELDMHVEQAVLPDSARAQYLLLSGLRDDHEHLAATLWVDGRDVFESLDDRPRRVLTEPRFRFKAPLLHGRDEETEPAPIFAGPESCVQIRAVLYGDLMRGIDPDAASALDALRCTVKRLTRPVRVTPGTMLVCNNLLGLHGRTPFHPRFDGMDRWLQRIIVAPRWAHRGTILEQGRIITL